MTAPHSRSHTSRTSEPATSDRLFSCPQHGIPIYTRDERTDDEIIERAFQAIWSSFYSVKSILEQGLDRVAQEYPELEATRRMIIPGGHSSVTTKGFNKSPDGQLAFKGAKISPFFLEVAHSQEEKALLNTLHEYFAKAPGCTVLSFDLDYAAPSTRRAEGYIHGASVSLATSKPDPEDPEYVAVEALVELEKFRQGGQAAQAGQGNLKIPFNLFVPLEKRGDLPACAAAASVNISFADPARFLSDAEEQQRIRDATPEPSKLIKGIKWRKRNGSVEASTIAPQPKRPQTDLDKSGGLPRRSQRPRSASTPGD